MLDQNKQTPMQELLEWVRATLPMDLDTPQMIEQKIESMLEKEKEQIVDFAYKCRNVMAADEFAISKWYDKTFNTNER